MYHLVYTSVATHPIEREALFDLLRESRDRNRQNNISGLLLHKNDQFVQVLEGEESQVKALFDRIRKDQRHQQVQAILEGSIPEREFADWSMGFREVYKPDLLGLYRDDKPLGKSLNIDRLNQDPEAALHLLRFIRDLELTQK
jgi:Mg2+ and Co2+ transporter CorA